MAAPFPSSALAETKHWADYVGKEWARSRPDVVRPPTNPRWLSDLTGWLDNAHGDDRARIERVMGKLRRAAPREYDVLYRTLLLGEGFEEVTIWLNERAVRNNIPLPDGKPTHYEIKDAVALFSAGVSFVQAYW